MLDFNETFQTALDHMEQTTDHIFLTGRAGTGKSTLLTYFTKNTAKPHAIIAPTGVAALNVKGETIHSFFGFRPNITPQDAIREARQTEKSQLYQKITTLIIDEISMVRADLVDCIDLFLKTVRNSPEPFGGVQMIFIGDIYQLPPVVTKDDEIIFTSTYASPYFFDSDIFHSTNFQYKYIELMEVYRQRDKKFINLLDKVRTNTITLTELENLNQRYNPDFHDYDDQYIYLTTTNKAAQEINHHKLHELGTRSYTYTGSRNKDFPANQLPTDEKLTLKESAQIMFLNNDPAGRWVNGTIGHILEVNHEGIIAITTEGKEVEVKPFTWRMYGYTYNATSDALSQEPLGSFTQLPVKLAWAITIHKSQGKTFDNVIIDLGWGSFAHGQTYVAFSRCRSLNGIILKKPIEPRHIIMDDRVKSFVEYLER
ncbi:AAA family ATPase [Candidatus Peregrinibacteria bacterium HGW-Peregrinibacteria-1]|jgi:ATP-dependent exoDNAse (exonuclease V) alpha subunit|nr:MAG: AAA family ATPase [Candidatus Peregrinibacteria bacterium HGW-Peregrinibacteria-1]